MKKAGKNDGYQRMADGKDRKSTIGKRSPFALNNQRNAKNETVNFQNEVLRRNNESVSSFGLQGSVYVPSAGQSSSTTGTNLQNHVQLRERAKSTSQPFGDGNGRQRQGRDKSPTMADDDDYQRSVQTSIKRQPTATARPSFVTKKPVLVQSSGKF